MPVITGVGVSPGRAVGPVVRMPDPVSEPPAEPSTDGRTDSATYGAARIEGAASDVRIELEARAARAHGEGRTVLEATALMAADPTLISAAQAKVTDLGRSPERAVWEAADEVTAMLSSVGGYMAERVRDVNDVRDRIIAQLRGLPVPGVPQRHEPFVLVAGDLAPADTATLDPDLVRALVTAEGGPTSHTAIIARALGIPAVVAARGALDLVDGSTVLVDGATGEVFEDPSAEQIAAVAKLVARHRTFSGAGATKDGHPVALLANIGDPKGAQAAAAAGAEGVGLFRTEFCFLDRDEAPSVAEQARDYGAVFAAFPGKKVVIRTLDAGADKPLPFLTDASEANPALGVRGIRTAWRTPDVLRDQLQAIATAAESTTADVWVMAPMVATVPETRDFVAWCTRAGLRTAGVMVEVPSAALCADQILAEAHFASIGTNDLTQYTMAADRMLGPLAALSTAWQPAVLRLVELTCEGGAANDRPVGVCGEAAADPALACVLVGLGVSSLSMTERAIADVAAVLAEVTYEECRALARVALDATSAELGKATVRERLPFLGDLGL